MLDVNGKRVIDRVDVLYRDELADDSGGDEPQNPSPKKAATSTKRAKPTPSSGSTQDDGGLLGSILGGLLGLRDLGHDKSAVSIPVNADLVPTTSDSGFQPTVTISPQHTPNNPQPAPTTTASPDTVLTRSSSGVEVGFIGIFFR